MEKQENKVMLDGELYKELIDEKVRFTIENKSKLDLKKESIESKRSDIELVKQSLKEILKQLKKTKRSFLVNYLKVIIKKLELHRIALSQKKLISKNTKEDAVINIRKYYKDRVKEKVSLTDELYQELMATLNSDVNMKKAQKALILQIIESELNDLSDYKKKISVKKSEIRNLKINLVKDKMAKYKLIRNLNSQNKSICRTTNAFINDNKIKIAKK